MSQDGEPFWKETARWMKYEQEFDEGSSQWGHPHVSALEVYSLRVVQKAMEEGLYLLDLPAVSGFAEVVQCVVDEAVRTHRLAVSSAAMLQEVLLLRLNHAQESTLWESITGVNCCHVKQEKCHYPSSPQILFTLWAGSENCIYDALNLFH